MSTMKKLRSSKAPKQKQKKRSLGIVLMLGLASVLLEALKWKWKCDTWEPEK